MWVTIPREAYWPPVPRRLRVVKAGGDRFRFESAVRVVAPCNILSRIANEMVGGGRRRVVTSADHQPESVIPFPSEWPTDVQRQAANGTSCRTEAPQMFGIVGLWGPLSELLAAAGAGRQMRLRLVCIICARVAWGILGHALRVPRKRAGITRQDAGKLVSI